jgi:hypothetical protein
MCRVLLRTFNPHSCPFHSSPFHSWSPIVFSLLGVLGITLVLFVVVALTAGLILGK